MLLAGFTGLFSMGHAAFLGVGAYTEAVMVNAEDANVRANRYALLARLRGLFLGVADISLLG